MEDYPRTVLELERRFATDDSCRDYLAQLRWPEGFACPRCHEASAWPASRGRYICRACRHQTSVTAGTIFENTRTPLPLWFRAIWYVTSQKNGASAANLQQILDLRSYETAWTWLHKLRRAMIRPGREKLNGIVEVDETYVGGEDPKEGIWTQRKAIVVIAAEEDGKKVGRIRMATVPKRSRKYLHRFVQDMVEANSIVHTDGFQAYQGLSDLGFEHRQSILIREKSKDAASQLLPHVHRVAALVKRWLLGTHQGAVRAAHLDYYLDEFTFRFNRRKSRSRGKLFYRLLQNAVQIDATPYKAIIGGKTTDHKIS